MGKVNVQPCPQCGAEMRYERHADEVSYLGSKRTLRTLGWWCSKCGEAILEGVALRAREKAYLALKAEIDGVLGPDEVAEVREALGLSQRKAGELLGGGPRSFQKYESGTQAVSVPMSHLLRLLANDPARLDEIRRERPSGRGGVRKARGRGQTAARRSGRSHG